MLDPLENYFISKPEPYQSCLLFLRTFILEFDKGFTEHFKFGTAFYYYDLHWCCYLSVNKKGELYIGFVHGNKIKHPKLKKEGRKQIRVFYIDPEKDIDIISLKEVLKLAVQQQKEMKQKK